MDISSELQQQVTEALAKNAKLAISAGHSKDFYGGQITGEDISLSSHSGIVDYDFRELVVTARAGTTLKELKQALADNGQMLAFEPPSFADTATLGGTLACGFSGPRRPYLGSARDFLLGTKIINGKAEQLTFGGQVMKNVAGYDLSRLMVGAMGTLGIILQASLKVLPKPECDMTLIQEKTAAEAIEWLNQLAGQNIPLSASAHFDGKLFLRFSSFESAVKKSLEKVGGTLLQDDESFWRQLTEHQHDFFCNEKTLWRISVPPATPVLNLKGDFLYEWGGAQRWFISHGSQFDSGQIHQSALLAGGHATQFRNANRQADVFQTLPPGLMKVHQHLKASMDPKGLLNPGRLYQAL